MRLSAPSAASGSAAQWAGPALLSVAVHLSLAAGYVFLSDTYTPPQPPHAFAVEIVLMQDAPGAGVAQPVEPATSVASAPAASAEQQPPPRETSTTEPVAAIEPGEPTSTAPPQEAPEPAALPVRVALHAPLPKRKPVLSPRPISMAEKAVSKPEPVTVDRSAGEHPTDPKPATRPATAPPSEIASAASAGAATATLIPPRYAAPGYGNPLPVYPRAAKRRGIEGRLVLRVRVDAKGRARKIDVVKSSGHGLLDSAAERAVRKWRFEPARRAGIPVSAALDVPVVFRLKD